MNFLVVNPWIYDFAAYDFWLKPLGLLYISEILKHFGHEVTFIDLLNRYDEDLKDFFLPKDRKFGTGKFYNEEVEKPKILKNIPRKFKRYGTPPQLFERKLEKIKNKKNIDSIFVGITLTYWYYGGLETVRILRRYFPSTPIILGGIYSTLYEEHAQKTFSNLGVTVCPGAGLKPIIKSFNTLGLDISKLSEFNWFDELELSYDFYKSYLSYIVLISSIGCPFHCTYCVTPKMWEFQCRDIDKIIKNIENLLIKRPYLKDIVFFDDAFLLRKDISEFLEALSYFPVRYHLPNGIHARRVNEEVAFLLKKANFKTIKLGYESYDFNFQKETGYKVTNKDLIRAVNNLKKIGFNMEDVSAYILTNLPNQKIEDIKQAIDFCYSLGISVNLNEFTPIPGTPDYNKLVNHGYLDLFTDPLLLNNTILPFWSNFGLSNDELDKIKKYKKLKYSN